jgi:hypothetical protein
MEHAQRLLLPGRCGGPANFAQLRAKTFWILVRATATAAKLLKELHLC